MQTTAPSSLSPWMDGAPSYSSPESRMPKVEIKSGPVSLRTLAVLGLIVFAIGFWHGREIRDVQTVVAEPTNHSAESQTAVVSASEDSTRAAAEPNRSSTTIPVTIRMVKFGLETVQINIGDTVEWANKDLTPHTVTSPPNSQSRELDSGSINAGASWRHRFDKSGTFPYFCTFHPEMKGTVVVK